MSYNRDHLIRYIFLHLSLCFFSFAGVIAKFASGLKFFSWKFNLLYGIELGILFVFAVFWQQILKNFQISIAYANRALVIIWSLIWAVVFFGEKITFNNMLGSVIVLTGVILISYHD